MKRFLPAIVFSVALFNVIPNTYAAGCLKGAAVGGAAGHFAGHHAILGAAVGCGVGHHKAEKDRKAKSNK